MNEIQTNASKRCLSKNSCAHSAVNCPSDGNSNKPRRDHWYSEEVEGCRLPPCAGVDRASEEQNRGNREQIVVTVEVIFTIHEGRPGQHLHAAFPVRQERLPAGALQRGQACDPEVRGSRAGSRRLRTAAGAARPHASFVSTLLGRAAEDRQERRVPATSSRYGVLFPSVPCSITGPSAGRARRATSSQTKRYRTLPESCGGSLSSEWEDAKRAGPGVARFVNLANLARPSHRPPTRVCPTHECGWLLASATSPEDGNWSFFFFRIWSLLGGRLHSR